MYRRFYGGFGIDFKWTVLRTWKGDAVCMILFSFCGARAMINRIVSLVNRVQFPTGPTRSSSGIRGLGLQIIYVHGKLKNMMEKVCCYKSTCLLHLI